MISHRLRVLRWRELLNLHMFSKDQYKEDQSCQNPKCMIRITSMFKIHLSGRLILHLQTLVHHMLTRCTWTHSNHKITINMKLVLTMISIKIQRSSSVNNLMKCKIELMNVIQNFMLTLTLARMVWSALLYTKEILLKVWLSSSVKNIAWMMIWKKNWSFFSSNKLLEFYQRSWRMKMLTQMTVTTLNQRCNECLCIWMKYKNNSEYTYFIPILHVNVWIQIYLVKQYQ